MNTANWIPDLFMKQVEADGPWYLFSPNEVPELHESFGEKFEKKYWKYVKKGQDGELGVFREVKAKDYAICKLQEQYEAQYTILV